MPTYIVTYTAKPGKPEIEEADDMDDLKGYVVGELGKDWERDILEVVEIGDD